MPTTQQTDDARATVLVVDDETALADLYARWLADEYDVETAYTGEDALKELTDEIDVVFLDRRMPDLSGDVVLGRIRENELDCRVVIVSAVTPDFDVIGMGFDDYLTKPIENDALHEAVEAMQRQATYDDAVQAYHRLATTKATLDAEKSQRERRASDEYAELKRRLESRRDEADDALTSLTDDDFETAFRQLDHGANSAAHETEED